MRRTPNQWKRRLRTRFALVTEIAFILFVTFSIPALTLADESAALRELAGMLAVGMIVISLSAFLGFLLVNSAVQQQRRRRHEASRRRDPVRA